jgi:dolichyldiphosphatase
VTGLTAALNLYTRSAGVAYFTIGALTSSATAKILKKVIRQPRPVSPYSHKRTYGYVLYSYQLRSIHGYARFSMPSTHSATITYYAIYIALASSYLPVHPSLLSVPLIRLAPLITTPWAASVLASRVWLGHHTWNQVAAGAACGSVTAFVWFYLWQHQGLSDLGNLLEREMAPYLHWS